MDVEKLVKKELLTMRGRSATRQMPQLPPNAINLLAGDPDFDQPDFISDAVYKAMKEGKTHYSFTGEPDLKEAIADYYDKYGVTIAPKTQVQITSPWYLSGAMQSCSSAFPDKAALLIRTPASVASPTGYGVVRRRISSKTASSRSSPPMSPKMPSELITGMGSPWASNDNALNDQPSTPVVGSGAP